MHKHIYALKYMNILIFLCIYNYIYIVRKTYIHNIIQP